jgi:hypothetical protein
MTYSSIPVTVNLPASEWEAAVEAAMARGTTLQAAMRECLRRYVGESGHGSPNPRNVALTAAEVRKRHDVDHRLQGRPEARI